MSLSDELNLDIPITDLRHETFLNIVHTANHLAAVGAAFLRPYAITEAQFNVLFSLKHKNCELTQSALSERLVVTRASVTSVLDKLEEKGFVERLSVPGNRRIYHVSLTTQGRTLIDEMEPAYRQTVHCALEELTEKDCKGLVRLLERVRSRTASLREDLQQERTIS
jgi:MarR family 2-MHQ and catechol resistance regulon transcriptional repressor